MNDDKTNYLFMINIYDSDNVLLYRFINNTRFFTNSVTFLLLFISKCP